MSSRLRSHHPADSCLPTLTQEAIPLLSSADVGSSTGAASIPFIASTFSHACPTRAPGDQTRMHSVLSSFFSGPVSGEEKKRRLTQRVQCKSLSTMLGPW